jgi:hypothetical protein
MAAWGIGLLEVSWNLLTSIIDGCLKAAISFCDALHGFQPGQGMMTAIIEVKCLAHLPIFKIFIDLKKAYDTLDKECMLEILDWYGIGEGTTLQLIWQFCDRQLIVSK